MDLRVVSLNVWGIPSPVGRHVDERMELIAARLPDFDAHVVVLQEVWTEASRETLLAGGLAAGYRHVWHLPTARGGSGLVALSRLPIEDVRFTPYFLCGLPQRFDHMDFYSGKGFVRLDIRFEDRPVAIFATHLIARYAPKDVADRYRGHRAAQVLQLADAVGKIDGPIIAVGDFNFTESSPEYTFFAGLTGLEDAAVALDARQNTSTLENAYRRARGAVGKSRIDYAFVRSGVKEGARATHVQTVFDEPLTIDGEPAAYSDHTGLLVDVRLGGNGRAVPVPTPEALQIARELLDEYLVVRRPAARKAELQSVSISNS